MPGDVYSPAFPYPMYATGADGTRIPVVTTAGGYKYVGRLIVEFDAGGRAVRVDHKSGPVRVAGLSQEGGVSPDPIMAAAVDGLLTSYISELADTAIASSQVALEGRRSPGIRTEETNLGNLMADSALWQARELAGEFDVASPDVAIQNGGGIRNDNLMPAGPFTLLNTFEIAPFTNFISVVENVDPETFKLLMENGVSNVENVDGRFPQIAGFTLVYNPSGQPQSLGGEGDVQDGGSRVVSIQLDDGRYIVQNGQVVPGAPSVNIATIDFLAQGGDQYPFPSPFTTLGVTYQQALESYVTNALGGVISAAQYPEGGEGRIQTGN